MKRRGLAIGLLIGVGAALVLGLSGCAGQKIESYANEQPPLDLQRYFNGTLDAHGVFTDRSGTVVKRFSVVMECAWVGNEGTLDERFTYSDGTTQTRVWHLRKEDAQHYSGTAGDVVGTAQGETRGNAFHWNYTLALPVGGSPDKPGDATIVNVQMDDWMYLMNDKVMLNKARMSKFGVHLGDVTLAFNKR